MRHRVALVRMGRLQTTTREYQEGVQAMWEARWGQPGAAAEACWLLCHGGPPPLECPLIGHADHPGPV